MLEDHVVDLAGPAMPGDNPVTPVVDVSCPPEVRIIRHTLTHDVLDGIAPQSGTIRPNPHGPAVSSTSIRPGGSHKPSLCKVTGAFSMMCRIILHAWAAPRSGTSNSRASWMSPTTRSPILSA